jgi:glycosyltransferase involved in cell wall biosynthesis
VTGREPVVEPTPAPVAAPGRRYCLVTPCRNEAAYARRTLDSVVAQTVPPALWVIVDDGSTDESPAILAEYAARFPWIRVLRRSDRGYRKLGGGVIDAFYEGYATIDPSEFDYVAKFDLDLAMPPRYFEGVMERMERDPRLGTLSGKPYFRGPDGELVAELCGDENSVGMVKLYRTACFEQVGFVRELNWDGIDGHRCRMLGWRAESRDDEELRFEHLRPMGTSDRSWWTGRVRHGIGQHYMGSSFLYVLASAVYRLPHPPIVLGSVAILWGYLSSAVRRRPRYPDPEFRRFLRRYQRRSLLRGKARATRELDATQAQRWHG